MPIFGDSCNRIRLTAPSQFRVVLVQRPDCVTMALQGRSGEPAE